MNELRGLIEAIETAESLALVSVKSEGHTFSAVIIESAETTGYLQPGREVGLVFKETEVSIGKGLSGGLSLRNRFPVQIREIRVGQILTQLTLDFRGHRLHSVITTRSARELSLQVGEWVEGLVKTNEITLMSIFSEQ